MKTRKLVFCSSSTVGMSEHWKLLGTQGELGLGRGYKRSSHQFLPEIYKNSIIISRIVLNSSSVSFCSIATVLIFYLLRRQFFIECLGRLRHHAKQLKFLVKYPDIWTQPQSSQNLDELQILFKRTSISQEMFLFDNFFFFFFYCKIKVNQILKDGELKPP